jgi:hypothetical protein
MASKKKKKAAKKKAAPAKKKAAKKKAAPAKKKAAPAKKKAAPKKAAPKKAAPKKPEPTGDATATYALPKKAAKKREATGYSTAAAAERSKGNGTNGAELYKGPNLGHHPVSPRQMEDVAQEGLRSDGEILHVEEKDFAPCRLVDHGEGRFSLCFDDFRMPKLTAFDERGLQGGGYTWEAVVDSLVRMRRPELLNELSYDSESGMFVALGSRDALKDVANLIQEAIANPQTLEEALDRADPDRLE